MGTTGARGGVDDNFFRGAIADYYDTGTTPSPRRVCYEASLGFGYAELLGEVLEFFPLRLGARADFVRLVELIRPVHLVEHDRDAAAHLVEPREGNSKVRDVPSVRSKRITMLGRRTFATSLVESVTSTRHLTRGVGAEGGEGEREGVGTGVVGGGRRQWKEEAGGEQRWRWWPTCSQRGAADPPGRRPWLPSRADECAPSARKWKTTLGRCLSLCSARPARQQADR